MLLEDGDIKEFQIMYEEEFGEAISTEEASILASRLITLYETLARPLVSEQSDFTDSKESGRLNMEVGSDQTDKPPPSTIKVAL
jgi:hypothetical protein